MTLKTADLDLAASEADEARSAARRRRAPFLARDTQAAWWFITPAFLLLAFLVAYPFVLSVWFSLSDARVGTAGGFVGLGNFERLERTFSAGVFRGCPFVNAVAEIKEAVQKLTTKELAEVSAFIALREAKDWDEKIDADFAPKGRLASVLEEVRADYDAGKTRDLP